MAFAFLFVWLLILGSCPRVSCCLQCDQVVRYVHEDFLSSVKGITVRDQIELKQIIEHAYVNFRDTSRLSRGVIDPTTLYRARTEYQSEFKRHWKEDRTGSIQWDMINILEKGKRILQKHLEIFVAQVKPLPSTTPRLIVTLPSLPSGYDSAPNSLQRSSFIIILVLLTVLSITGSLVLIVNLSG
ncbi:izumo sperm-egg fusion 1 [Labeo rohita]|uniref:Izumo sperm-egg fusion 1 n=1 Tax=Labeo rohita TaxID=84645 RepID=A0A498LG50_LABRO|nr:izumo sperm-egg fusion 1 [Labeo rohita]